MATLRDKVTVFRDNPEMRIVITGYASEPGTDAYNMALGMRRADAAKAQLVSLGVDGRRIEIATRGANELVIEGPGETADEANRRGEFRIQLMEASPPSRD
jgi:peptidoglycan-associated lipoprotein